MCGHVLGVLVLSMDALGAADVHRDDSVQVAEILAVDHFCLDG